ncbi:MAG: DUF2851 family protein [Bacteroidales bacterium]
MKEHFLHFLWKYKLFEFNQLQSDDGQTVEIVNTGEHNMNAGPDFLNARVKLNNTTWVGNVEIHVNSNDWNKHQHSLDPNYNNVILHVVENYEGPVSRETGEIIPTLKLRYNSSYYDNYFKLVKNTTTFPCAEVIHQVEPFHVFHWFESAAIERISKKAGYLLQQLKSNKNNWEETFYQALARGFGANLNSFPFEALARSIPLQLVRKNMNSRDTIEALFYGQAGFLEEKLPDLEYHKKLRAEYKYLRNKYSLMPLPVHLWKFMRLRPMAFPTIRVSQFCDILINHHHLAKKITETDKLQDLSKILTGKTSPFWETHYSFIRKHDVEVEKKTGQAFINTIMINTVVPFLFVYGNECGESKISDRALEILSQLPPEKNKITGYWQSAGINPKNALNTQAMIHVSKEYCNFKKCLSCGIGLKLISR